MKRILSMLLVLSLGACSGSSNANESATTKAPAPTTIAPTKAPAPTTIAPTETAIPTETTTPTREAVVIGIENDVLARALFGEDLLTASVGLSIHPSGSVQTGVDGHARIDLLPEGTIARVGVNSSFAIIEITLENGQPKTTLELLSGKIFILLNGGLLDVKTSMGVASVSGSLMRVEYDPQKQLLKVSCLDGHCALKNKNGEVMELIAGEFSYISGSQPPIDPKKIYREEIQEWLDEIPELLYFLAELPNPKDFRPVFVPTPTRPSYP